MGEGGAAGRGAWPRGWRGTRALLICSPKTACGLLPNFPSLSYYPSLLHSPPLRREIVIHVCDETRGTKKDFTCPQGLLLEKMVYFRDITLGQQLDDVDISVHCDVKIFDWLM